MKDLIKDHSFVKLARCSKLIISGSLKNPLKNEEFKFYIDNLIERGIILDEEHSSFGALLLKQTNEAIQYFRTKDLKKMFTGKDFLIHEPLLNYLLINNDFVITKELFIWKELNTNELDLDINYIIGHIDLVCVLNDTLYISDFKPFDKYKSFFYSLPQVAFYGLILKELSNLSKFKLKCISFNEKEIWEYDCKIILSKISEIIKILKENHPEIYPIWELIL